MERLASQSQRPRIFAHTQELIETKKKKSNEEQVKTPVFCFQVVLMFLFNLYTENLYFGCKLFYHFSFL